MLPVASLPVTPLLAKAALLTSQTFKYEGVATPIEVRTTYEYDGEVRVSVEHDMGIVDVSGDEKVVKRFYASDDTTWVRDRVWLEMTNSLAGVTFEQKENRYGSESGAPLDLGQIGRGYLRQIDGWSTQLGRLVTLKSQDFDACGNVANTTSGGVTRAFIYDARAACASSPSRSRRGQAPRR